MDGWGLSVETNVPALNTTVRFRAIRGSETRVFDFPCKNWTFTPCALWWKGWFTFGFGWQAVLIAEGDARKVDVALDCYFEALHALDDCLLVVSGQGIVCIRPDGAIAWRNETLAIDGVIVNEIAGGVIAGDGEWDPPGGWRPFRISLSTGHAVS